MNTLLAKELCHRVSQLNPDAGVIGAGMLRQLVDIAKAASLAPDTICGRAQEARPMKNEALPLILTLRKLMVPMTGEERLEVRDALLLNYCESCGGTDRNCQCANDE